jgi:hypothetical protein
LFATNFDLTRVSFDDLDEGSASRLHTIPTRLALPANDVDALIGGGADAIGANEALRELFLKASHSKEPQ